MIVIIRSAWNYSRTSDIFPPNVRDVKTFLVLVGRNVWTIIFWFKVFSIFLTVIVWTNFLNVSFLLTLCLSHLISGSAYVRTWTLSFYHRDITISQLLSPNEHIHTTHTHTHTHAHTTHKQTYSHSTWHKIPLEWKNEQIYKL